MTTETTKVAFKPTAVLITPEAEWEDNNGNHVDPEKVTLLHLEDNWLYTRDEWEHNREPRIYRDGVRERYQGLEDGERVELLPDLWILKIDETEFWIDPVVCERVQRVFGVYVFDRRQHFHLCNLSASYEMTFLGSQFEPIDGLTDKEDEDLAERIQEGDWQTDEWVKYMNMSDVDRLVANECREGFYPDGKGGGFKFETGEVATADAIAEVQDTWNTSTL
jgi:hypothetical protein